MIEVRLLILYLDQDRYEKRILSGREFVKFFELFDDYVYDVGFDQSTSCTGLSIKDVDSKVIVMCELVNRHLDKPAFIRVLLTIVDNLFKSKNIRYVFVEEPLKFITGHQEPILVELKNRLVELLSSKPNIQHVKLIQPQSWRSGLIGKDNPHAKNSKSATVWEVERRYSKTRIFESLTYNPSDNGGYDGFESLGILLGSLDRYNISKEDTIIKNIGPKNSTKIGVGFFCKPNDFQNYLKLVDMIVKDYNKPKMKIYNEEETIYANVKMALTDDVSIMEISEPIAIIDSMIKFNLEVDDSQLFLIVVPLNKLSKNIIPNLRSNGINVDIYY